MSDEAAFLAALKANPADDTTRLVYADWLDEHGEPQKAEYLRLVAAFAQRGDNLAPLSGAKEFSVSATAIPHEWRAAAGARFALIIEAWTDKIKAIKWIREVTGDGLGESKAASESLPHALFDAVPFEVAYAAYERVKGCGFASVRLKPGPLDVPPHSARFELVVHASVTSGRGSRERADAARAALAAVLAALGLSEEQAVEHVELDRVIVLAPNLTLQEARNRRALIERLIPPYDANRGWYLWIDRRETTPTDSP